MTTVAKREYSICMRLDEYEMVAWYRLMNWLRQCTEDMVCVKVAVNPETTEGIQKMQEHLDNFTYQFKMVHMEIAESVCREMKPYVELDTCEEE